MKHSRIKILMVLGNTSRCGAQTFAVNILKGIDKSQFQIDFAVYNSPPNGYGEEIISLGSKIHIIPQYKVFNQLYYESKFAEVCKDYDIVHGHVSSTASIYLKVAKRNGCKTIVHSHSAGYRGNAVMRFIKKLYTKSAKKYADRWFACSDLAAERLFGNEHRNNVKYYSIPNAIDVSLYRFDKDCRYRIRERLCIDQNAFVCGHVGSLTTPKNHKFLLDVFKEILNKNKQSKLILCGDGILMSSIKNYAEQLGVSNSVIFTGNVPNVNEYLMAMDVFLFPSVFEGFPTVTIEAQSAGLFVVASDRITREVSLTSNIMYISLESSALAWSEEILNLKKVDRYEANDLISQTRYNLEHSIKDISIIYREML